MKGFDDYLDNYGNPGAFLNTRQSTDDDWYEAYAEYVHSIGKKWPDILSDEEQAAAAEYADSKAPRPECEMDDE